MARATTTMTRLRWRAGIGGGGGPDPQLEPVRGHAPVDQARLAWLMQKRVAGMASSRAGWISSPQTSQRP